MEGISADNKPKVHETVALGRQMAR